MKLHPDFRAAARRGFTLVEMLVATSVLVLLVGLSTQMFNTVAAVTTGNVKHLDADSQARQVLDRMAGDFARMVVRPDVDYYFQKDGTPPSLNDQFAFYSETTGYYPSGTTTTQKSEVSLVGYRINASNQLERLSKALVWNGTSGSGSTSSVQPMVYSATPGKLVKTWPNIAANGADPDYQVMGDQVFRLETCFLARTDATVPGSLSANPYLAPHTAVNGMQDVVGVVVSMALLDTRSRVKVTASQLAAAANNLRDFGPSINGVAASPAALWKQDIAAGNLGLPRSVAAQVRVYERCFYVNSKF